MLASSLGHGARLATAVPPETWPVAVDPGEPRAREREQDDLGGERERERGEIGRASCRERVYVLV